MALRCILIDDEEHSTQTLEVLLRKYCPEVDIIGIFHEGIEALEFMATQPPDLLFLDINMPMINGWEFLEQYEQLEEDQKGEVICIMLTTSINPSDEERAKKYSSIRRYLPKPLSEADLMMILQEYFPDRF